MAQLQVLYQQCLHRISKNVLTLASRSFDKHGLILIIFRKQHQHTFKNGTHIQLSLSLHFCLCYLFLNSCNRNDVKHNVYSLVDCW